MRHQHAVIHYRALDFWMARAAVLVIICLQLLVINNLSFGPRWLAPGLEAALLLPCRWPRPGHRPPQRGGRGSRMACDRSVSRHDPQNGPDQTAIISVGNCGSLVLLVRLAEGHAGNGGTTLLIDASTSG